MRTFWKTRARRAHGFTLIELLVVVSILAILAAILFPVFARVRENARRTNCLSNLKQIGTGLLQYSQDYDEQLIRSWYGANGPSDAALRYKWMDAVLPYVKSEQIFNCPSHNRYPFGGPFKSRDGGNYGSYGINSAYWGDGDNLQSPAGEWNTLLSSVQDPAGCVWVGETNGHLEFAWENIADQPDVVEDSPRWMDWLNERHFESAPILFTDGHVKPMRLHALAVKNSSGAYPAFTIQDDDQ